MNSLPPIPFDARRHTLRRATLGLLVIGFGVMALLDNLQLFGIPLVHTFWPLALVVWGLARLAWPHHAGNRVFGLVLVVIGALLTAHNLGYGNFSLHQWWPLFVIAAGASIFLRGCSPRRHGRWRGRFAAAEVNPPDQRGRAISYVVLGGVVGTVLSRLLAVPVSNFAVGIGMDELAGAYLTTLSLFGVASVLVMVGLRPDPRDIGREVARLYPPPSRTGGTNRPLAEILSQPAALSYTVNGNANTIFPGRLRARARVSQLVGALPMAAIGRVRGCAAPSWRSRSRCA